MNRCPPPAIPLTILTGRRGAGKTTLLNRILHHPLLEGTLVIVNETGATRLDHALVEMPDTDVARLASGCLCCSLRGDLIRLLEDLLRRRDNKRIPAFTRLVLETTGSADPASIIATVSAHPYLSLRYGIAGVITVVDACDGDEALATPEWTRQIAAADGVVLTGLEQGAAKAGLALTGRLATLNPAAPVITADALAADPSWAFGTAGHSLADKPEAHRRRVYSAMMAQRHDP